VGVAHVTRFTALEEPVTEWAALSEIGRAFRSFEQAGMHETLARARAEEPVFFAPDIGYYVVTRRADVLAVFRDHNRFSASIALNPMRPLPAEVCAFLREGRFTHQQIQANADQPVHTRVRAAAAQFLNMRRFLGMEAEVRALVEDYADRLEGAGIADLVAEMTYELPIRAILLLLGIPASDAGRIKRWADKRLMFTFGALTPAEQMDAARDMLAYWHYCRELVEDRVLHPGADYPSAMLAIRGGDDSVLTLNEITGLVFGILLAGHETTTNASTNLIHALLSHPGEWARVVADPSLIPNAVEEGLRFASSVVSWRRIAKEDVEIGGVVIPKGGHVLLSLASANRDAAEFADADRLDVGRANARHHTSFGYGIHVCIGAPLARLQLRLILEVLALRFPAMELAPGQRIEWLRTLCFRGPQSLQVAPHGLAAAERPALVA
jgi:cytochrome P450